MDETLQQQVITKTISIDAPAAKVWDALTIPALMKQWMLDTELEIESGWEEGSPIIFRGDLHDSLFENRGVILKFRPHKIFEYSYLSNLSRLPDEPGNHCVITFTLNNLDGQTILELKLRNFVAETSYEHANFYWTTTLGILKKFVERL